MPDVTPVQELILHTQAAMSRYSDWSQRDGITGKARHSAVSMPKTPSATTASKRNAEKPVSSTESNRTLSPEWSNCKMTQEVAKTQEFPLDNLASLFAEWKWRKEQIDAHTKWCDAFKDQIDRLSGDADILTIAGHQVATYKRNGNLSVSRLEKEQPEIVAEYTKLVTELKFDRARFQAEQPELFAAYRARVFLPNEGVTIQINQ